MEPISPRGGVTGLRTAVIAMLVTFAVPPGFAAAQRGAPAKADAQCIALAMPTVQGIPGNAVEVASGVRDLVANELAGARVHVVVLEARLPSQAMAEAKSKKCDPLLFVGVTRKSGGGRLSKALGQAAGSSSWYLPGGGTVTSATARAAAAGGLQAVSSVAASTKAKDELRLEYRLQTAAGQIQFGPRTETQKASVDGEDVLTPVVMRAAEAIVTRTGSK